MITVHHLNNSRSQRVLWLLEELDLPYEVKRYERLPSMMAPPALKAVHPLGKAPVITDGDITLAESGAIVDYLIETYGNGRLIPPAGTPERQRYRYWLHYAEGSAMPYMVASLVLSQAPNSPQFPRLLRPLGRRLFGGLNKSFFVAQVKMHGAYWEAELARAAYFAGDALTGADIMMSMPVEAFSSRIGPLTPRLRQWLDGIQARPAYKKALERGGPYEVAGTS